MKEKDMNLKKIMMATAVTIPMVAGAQGHGIDRSNLDASANPKGDFYDYACGGWIKSHPLTGEYARYGMFDLLRDNARDQLKELVLNLKDDPQAKVPGSIAQKVSDLYEMGLDTERLNREGAEPIRPLLEKISTAGQANLPEMLGWQAGGIGSSFFSIGVGADVNNADMNIMGVGEVGVGLGDRDYYLEDTEENRKLLEAYHNYIITILTLAGYSKDDATRMADLTLKFEKEVAKQKKTREERRNPALRNNVMTYADFKAKYNNFDWDRFFVALGIPAPEKLNVSSPRFMEFINDYLPTLTDEEIRDLMTVETVGGATGLLGEAFTDADFEMFDKLLSGKTEQEPRWKRAMAIPNSMFGEAIGQLYVQKHFPESNKEAMKKLVENLRVALGQHIDNLPWMSEKTKRKAHEKLATFTVKIGYPDKWKDYSKLEIDPSLSYWENVHNAQKWAQEQELAKWGKPVDRTEWGMTPQTINAYYNPLNNEIVFPAGILQAPFFDPNASDAENYGGIGVVIGHEMTHGFDDQGCNFDADGNMFNWWTAEDAQKFGELTKGLVEQFNEVEVLPGLQANGQYTLGENIADHGGLRIARTAFLDSQKKKGVDVNDESAKIDGLTPMQAFYMNYANLWAQNIRDEEARRLTTGDVHSLGQNRVNVTLRNITPFFEAFQIKEGDKMFRPEEERLEIW